MKKSLILTFIITMGLMLTVPAYTQPDIQLSGATLNQDFDIVNSNIIVFGFNRVLGLGQPAGNTEITISLPSSASGYPCTVTMVDCGCLTCYSFTPDVITERCGSQVGYIVDNLTDEATFTVLDFSETPGTALFVVRMEATGLPLANCDWIVSISNNADMQFARAIPDIEVDYPAVVSSGQTGVALDASATVPCLRVPFRQEPLLFA